MIRHLPVIVVLQIHITRHYFPCHVHVVFDCVNQQADITAQHETESSRDTCKVAWNETTGMCSVPAGSSDWNLQDMRTSGESSLNFAFANSIVCGDASLHPQWN